MPKNIPSLKPKELIRLLRRGGCNFYREGKATTNCMFATAKAEKELFLLIWARENYRLLMCFAYFGNLVLQMRK